jgi:hypothetical protein
MARCAYCGVENEAAVGPCILCGRRLASGPLLSEITLRRLALAILIPLLVWVLAKRGLGL